MQQNLMFEFALNEKAVAEAKTDWRLDEDTKAAGRRGIQMARQTLAAAQPMAA